MHTCVSSFQAGFPFCPSVSLTFCWQHRVVRELKTRYTDEVMKNSAIALGSLCSVPWQLILSQGASYRWHEAHLRKSLDSGNFCAFLKHVMHTESGQRKLEGLIPCRRVANLSRHCSRGVNRCLRPFSVAHRVAPKLDFSARSPSRCQPVCGFHPGFLQQLRDQPPAWTQRQGRQASPRDPGRCWIILMLPRPSSKTSTGRSAYDDTKMRRRVDDDGQTARTHKELQAHFHQGQQEFLEYRGG